MKKKFLYVIVVSSISGDLLTVCSLMFPSLITIICYYSYRNNHQFLDSRFARQERYFKNRIKIQCKSSRSNTWPTYPSKICAWNNILKWRLDSNDLKLVLWSIAEVRLSIDFAGTIFIRLSPLSISLLRFIREFYNDKFCSALFLTTTMNNGMVWPYL